MARPPKDEADRLTEHLTVRLTKQEKHLIDSVAGDRNGSNWARQKLLGSIPRYGVLVWVTDTDTGTRTGTRTGTYTYTDGEDQTNRLVYGEARRGSRGLWFVK